MFLQAGGKQEMLAMGKQSCNCKAFCCAEEGILVPYGSDRGIAAHQTIIPPFFLCSPQPRGHGSGAVGD